MATKLPPNPVGVPPGSSYWNDWYEKLRKFVDDITSSVDWNILTNIPGWITASTGGGNPTASIGLTAINGTSNNFLRADAAPSLNQAIAPTWSGVHKYSFNGASLPTGVTGMMAQYGNADGVNTRVLYDAFGATSNINGRRANNTAASPSALASGDTIFSIAGLGYGSTAYSSTSKAQVSFKANQAWTDANQGTRVEISTTPNGSTTQAIALTIENNGAITVAGGITHGSSTLLTTTTALTNGAGAAAGTIANAPSAGNPTKWVPINDNGTTRYIPAW